MFVNIELSRVPDEGAMASSSSPMDVYLAKHRTLVLQAEELATAARREAKGMPSVLPGQEVDTRKSANALVARRKLMEMSKVIASIERLSQQHLCDPSVLDDVTTLRALAVPRLSGLFAGSSGA